MGRSLNPCDTTRPSGKASYFADLFEEKRSGPAARRHEDGQQQVAHHHPDKGALVALGERMLRSARLHRQPLSLLVLQVSDLPELEILFGAEAANRAVHAVMNVLGSAAGHTGLAVRTAPDTFALVMPRCNGEKLEAALRHRLDQACCLELDFNEEEIVLVPDIQARTVEDGVSVEKTYSVLCRAIESKRFMEQMRKDYLRREREAHSTHMGLPPELANTPKLPSNGGWRPTLPATIAMPMGRH